MWLIDDYMFQSIQLLFEKGTRETSSGINHETTKLTSLGIARLPWFALG